MDVGRRGLLALAYRRPRATTAARRADAAGVAVHAGIDGPRGIVQVFVVMLDYPLHASGIRQHQVRELADLVSEAASPGHPVIICGDFNAGPDSGELRMLTGRSQPPVPGMVFYDAWEVAGDGGPGFTWSNQNPLAAVSLLPDRRFDCVLSAWPRRGCAGHPVRCKLLGFLWGSAAVSRTCGFLWGSQKPLTCLAGPTRGAPQVLQLLDADDHSPSATAGTSSPGPNPLASMGVWLRGGWAVPLYPILFLCLRLVIPLWRQRWPAAAAAPSPCDPVASCGGRLACR